MNEPLDLKWSYRDSNIITLEPGIGQRLNLVAVTSNDVMLQTATIPVGARSIFAINRYMLFEVRVTGNNCLGISTFVKIKITPQASRDLNDARAPLHIEAEIVESPNGNRIVISSGDTS